MCPDADADIVVQIRDPQYTEWVFIDARTGADVVIDGISPAAARLFHGDTIQYIPGATPPFLLKTSPVATLQQIPGVMLFSSPPCGMCPRTGKMLYRVIPDDRTLPEFLVPAKPKIEFCKAKVNTYVLFAFREWVHKHPTGTLMETIGRVDDLQSYYMYSMHLAGIVCPAGRATQCIRKAIAAAADTLCPSADAPDRRADPFETRDSTGAITFDDALYGTAISNTEFRITVAIANVAAIVDSLQCWDALTNRVATIYMPDQRHTMLPPILGDELCSLVAGGKDKIAMLFDFLVCVCINTDGVPTARIAECTITPVAKIRVVRNGTFADAFNDVIQSATRSLDPTVVDTPGIVQYWMRAANTETARILASRDTLSLYTDETTNTYVLHPTAYARITSPIRRLADIINQIGMMGAECSVAARAFAAARTTPDEIERLNHLTYTTRKAQSTARMLALCNACPDQRSYTGISKPNRMVFFPDLRVWFRDPRPVADTPADFVFVLFPGEHTPYRKVRIMEAKPTMGDLM